MKITLKAPRPWDGVDDVQIEQFPSILGRRGDSDVALPYAFISRQHCQLNLIDGQVIVQDLESFNGTFINGRRLALPAVIDHGDEISLGPLSFRVFLHSPTGETTIEGRKIPTHQMPKADESHICFWRNVLKQPVIHDPIRL